MVELAGDFVQGGVYKVYTDGVVKGLAATIAKRIRRYTPRSPEEYEELIWSFVEKEWRHLVRNCDGLLVIFLRENRAVVVVDLVELVDLLEEVGLYDMV